MSNTEEQLETKTKTIFPSKFKVILHNDDYTTMEFVILVLTSIFLHDEMKAEKIMMEIHQNGSGIAGMYSQEIAESKKIQVDKLASEHEFPLKCTLSKV